MKTIAIASAKGGSAKTVTTVTLAWRAAQEFGRVAMIDLNEDQGTLTQWWTLRGRTVNPYLLRDRTTLEEDLKVLEAERYDVCFIDTPPLDMELIEMAVVAADAVIVPLLPSHFDTSAVDSVVDMCRRRRKPYAFLLCAFDKRRMFDAVNREAEANLKGRGTIIEAHLSYSPKYRLAQIDGQTGPEKDADLKKEVTAVWDAVKALAGIETKVVPLKGRAHG